MNFVLMIGSALEPERFRRRTFPVDPFAASLAAIDFLLNCDGRQQSASEVLDVAELAGRRFKVALSFPGEKREFVSEVAEGLSTRLGPGSVFYDKYYEHELARPNLDTVLQKVYQDSSDLVVVFLCGNMKRWNGAAWSGELSGTSLINSVTEI